MQIEIPDNHLIFLCGGRAGDKTDVDLGKIVMDYLYGHPDFTSEREIALGVVLVRKMADQIRRSR
jgi:hypothetical protein